MRRRRVILRCAGYYVAFCFILAIALGELAFRTIRMPIDRQHATQQIETIPGAVLEDVSLVSSDGKRLCGWFARPAKGRDDAVILLHGVGDNRQGMLGFAELFLSKGYVVLLPDLRGHGESGGFPTYGFKEVGDVQQWVDWLVSRANPHCIFGMGESMGAAIILQATKSVPFCAVAAESSFASFRQIAYIRVGQFFGAGSWVGRIALRPAVELAFLHGWLKMGTQTYFAAMRSGQAGFRDHEIGLRPYFPRNRFASLFSPIFPIFRKNGRKPGLGPLKMA